MQVRMRIHISGTFNGADWPERGGVIEVPETVAADLAAAGYAEPYVEEVVPDAADENEAPAVDGNSDSTGDGTEAPAADSGAAEPAAVVEEPAAEPVTEAPAEAAK